MAPTTINSTNRWILVTLTVMFLFALQSMVHSAPAISDSNAIGLMEKIIQSKMVNQCNHNQDRKDLCERCSRYVVDDNAFLGCCTNYDGIGAFCQEFINYTFEKTERIRTESDDSYMK
ncbi:hypothetical protein BLOT_007496 [Blomia tropicalis]|nr:hypothetical protein BLOT_007496 [Blomia tropicalis]